MSTVAYDSGYIKLLNVNKPVTKEQVKRADAAFKQAGIPILKGKKVTPPKKNRQIIAVNVRKMF